MQMVFNGINGADGTYLVPPLESPERLLPLVEAAGGRHLAELMHASRRANESTFVLRDGIDPKDLSQAGWCAIFPAGGDAGDALIREALAPLLEHRRNEAARRDERLYREFSGDDGYRSGETVREFMRRHRVAVGAGNPVELPFYVALIGGPDRIPFSFQYQLDVQRGVGRIAFDTPEEFARYASNVVAADRAAPRRPRAFFFAPRNPDDRATRLSESELARPLADYISRTSVAAVETAFAQDASKQKLTALLDSEQAPDILFTASHGMAFPPEDPRQTPHQGALLCQNWQGPEGHRGPISESHYFSGDDLASGCNASGLIAIHFACYSAGTPQADDFAHARGIRPDIAEKPFVAGLARKMLSAERGGLAVIGHNERAWGCSFWEAGVGRQLGAFEDMLGRLLGGHRVGWAMEPFSGRYAELSTELAAEFENRSFGDRIDERRLLYLWTESNDARNYVVVGDPAVRCNLTSGDGDRDGVRTEG